MKLKSIKTIIVIAVAACLVLGLTGILTILHVTFTQNSQMMALETVQGAQKLFGILEAREISKMQAVGDSLLMNHAVGDALASKKRDRLLAETAPLYTQLRQEGITNWLFHAPESEKTVFLRLHNPGKFGDPLNRFMYDEAVRKQSVVTGNELAKAGFAVRVMRPYLDSKQQVVGYLELGEEIGHFIRDMKGQTGDDYGLLLKKQYLDKKSWSDSMALLKQRDNWEDNPDLVVADKTTKSEAIFQFQGDITDMVDSGKVLERYEDGDTVKLRGLFPVRDASGKKVGAMFVVHDITALYQGLQHTQNLLIMVIVGVLILTVAGLLALLTILVFRRLDRIIAVATRVVGGDYETQIEVKSDDEIGQFESLFEQFRCVFVDLLHSVHETQSK